MNYDENELELELSALPADERRAAAALMKRLQAAGESIPTADAIAAARALIAAALRSHRRQDSDRATDHRRRVLVGARIPRDIADQCRAAADEQGISLYAWTTAAIRRALDHSQDEARDD